MCCFIAAHGPTQLSLIFVSVKWHFTHAQRNCWVNSGFVPLALWTWTRETRILLNNERTGTTQENKYLKYISKLLHFFLAIWNCGIKPEIEICPLPHAKIIILEMQAWKGPYRPRWVQHLSRRHDGESNTQLWLCGHLPKPLRYPA